MARRFVIVGAGYSGVLFANRLARKSREAAIEIVLASSRPWFVERVRLHQDVAGGGLRRRPLASLIDRHRVRLRIGTAQGIDLRARRVLFDAGGAEAFDELVVATGSISSKGDVPGAHKAHSCETDDEAASLRGRLGSARGGSVVVVGGGATGVELASELADRRRDLRVALVTRGQVGAAMSGPARARVRAALGRLGVGLLENTQVVAVEPGAVVLSCGETMETQVTVWCTGLEPTPLCRIAGLDVDAAGRAIVDPHLRSESHPFVRVIGDAARVVAAGHNRALRMACATALPQAAFAADDVAAEIASRPRRPFSFAFLLQCVSLGRRRAVVQLLARSGTPTRLHCGGAPAAWLKERVCRYALASARYGR